MYMAAKMDAPQSKMRTHLEHKLASLQNLIRIITLKISVQDLTARDQDVPFAATLLSPQVCAAVNRENKVYSLPALAGMVRHRTRETGLTFLKLIDDLRVEEDMEYYAG